MLCVCHIPHSKAISEMPLRVLKTLMGVSDTTLPVKYHESTCECLGERESITRFIVHHMVLTNVWCVYIYIYIYSRNSLKCANEGSSP